MAQPSIRRPSDDLPASATARANSAVTPYRVSANTVSAGSRAMSAAPSGEPVVIALMMEIPNFNHLNVSVTLDQGALITQMVNVLLSDHVRVRGAESDFRFKPSALRATLITKSGNIRVSECRASSVRNVT